MKCPRCQAKLLPVAGELFCLQCGTAVHEPAGEKPEEIKLEDTADPVLQRAIDDAVMNKLHYRPAQPELDTAVLDVLVPVRAAGGAASVMPAAPPRLPWWIVRATLIVVAGLVVFWGANVAAAGYYANRVYPGVKVNSLAVGGWTFAQLHERLPKALKQPQLSAKVNGQTFQADLAGRGDDAAAVESRVRAAGRSTPLPAVAWVASWLSPPIASGEGLTDEVANQAAVKLAATIDRMPSDAAVVMNGANVVLLAEKPGVKLDQKAAAAAIKAAYGKTSALSLKTTRVAPAVVASDYAAEVTAAQQLTGLSIGTTVRNVRYAPTPAQIGGWLVLTGPGKGVAVDPAGAAGFIAGIPGSFDRASAVSGLLGALNARQGAELTPPIKPATAQPKPASMAGAGPVREYHYCSDTPAEEAAGFKAQLSSALAEAVGWSLNGRIHFVYSAESCNFTVHLFDKSQLTALDPACARQTSCRIHNELAINTQNWTALPKGWSGNLVSYQRELLNHVVGEWLGFDHPACSDPAASSPVLSAPSVVIPGCSPNWYAVPPELQDTKVLPGL
jgi:hypothetical protein